MLDRIQSTERRIVRSAGTPEDLGDYIVTRSPAYPKWCQANMIELRVSGGRTLADWEAVFREHFDPSVYRHLMLYLPLAEGFESLRGEIGRVMESGDRGTPPLVVQRITWMFAADASGAAPLPEGTEVRAIESEDEHRALIDFGIEEARDEPWFTSDDDARVFLESRREITDRIGVRWYALREQGDPRILSRLGMFEHGGICRLQSVGTLGSHRRRGLGSAIVGFAIDEAHRRGAEGLALSTETGTGSHTMYTNAGFEPVGSDVWAMRYPEQAAAAAE